MNLGTHGHGRNISKSKLAVCLIILLVILSPIAYSINDKMLVPQNTTIDHIVYAICFVIVVWLLYRILTRGYTPNVNDEYNRIISAQEWKKVIDHIDATEKKESDQDLKPMNWHQEENCRKYH